MRAGFNKSTANENTNSCSTFLCVRAFGSVLNRPEHQKQSVVWGRNDSQCRLNHNWLNYYTRTMWNKKPNASWHVNFPLFSASHRPVWCRNLEIKHDFLGFSLKKSRFLDKAFIHLNISTFPFFFLSWVFLNCNRPYSHTCYFKNYAGNENLINGRHTAQNYKLLCDQTARIWAETLGDDFSEFFF